jgi:hypothetical protein
VSLCSLIYFANTNITRWSPITEYLALVGWNVLISQNLDGKDLYLASHTIPLIDYLSISGFQLSCHKFFGQDSLTV